MDKHEIIKHLDSMSDDEFFRVVPYAKHAISAYKLYRKWRISLFLKSIDFASDSLPQKDKAKFEKYISGQVGRELLAEYSDSVLSTSSKIAIAALGILYADVNNDIYTDDFKRIACRSLQGVTDGLMEAFILLCELEFKSEAGPYPLCKLNEDEFQANTALKERIETAEDAFACIAELIRRGMFLPDHIPSRVAGGKWFINFGVTEISLEIKKLLLKAKTFIET